MSMSGRAFNWGGGPGNAISLRPLIDEIGRPRFTLSSTQVNRSAARVIRHVVR